MNGIQKVWRPSGIPQNLEEALSVPATPDGQMSPDVYRQLLMAKLESLIRVNVRDAQAAMQMSQESAPELWSIAAMYPSNQWAAAIVNSDGMSRHLRSMRMEGVLMDPPHPPMTFREVLEALEG